MIINRETFLLKMKTEDGRDSVKAFFENLPEDIREIGAEKGVDNFSLWYVDGLIFGYYETTRNYVLTAEDTEKIHAAFAPLGEICEILGEPITRPMRLMYQNLGMIREDKSLIRHRVFATKLKPGCAEEYKRRHDELSAKQSGKPEDGPNSNFTIWNADRYILGYCELVRAFDHEMTDEEKASSIAWETRGLEIMDWITDDVDWITGEHHSKIMRLC